MTYEEALPIAEKVLTEEELKKWKDNFDEERAYRRRYIASPYDIVDYTMYWGKTLQGHDYWSKINERVAKEYPTMESLEVTQSQSEDVTNPDHYKSHPSGVECIEITKHMDFTIGNAMKYLWRAGLKNGQPTTQDLRKAIWYIECKIKMIDGE